jgi:hypothetical protein
MALTAADVENAFAFIRKNGFAPNRDSTKWDIIDPKTQEPFPPKAVLRVAYELKGQQGPNVGGGPPTNDPLRALGFKILLKPHLEQTVIARDIKDIFQSDENETTKQRLVNARVGQGQFREDLLERWNNKCAVTGCNIPEVLRASHIQAWEHSSDRERLDGHNGILLAASLDALFDEYLITFTNAGTMRVNRRIKEIDLNNLGVPKGVTVQFKTQTQVYLEIHRNKFEQISGGKWFDW